MIGVLLKTTTSTTSTTTNPASLLLLFFRLATVVVEVVHHCLFVELCWFLLDDLDERDDDNYLGNQVQE